MTFIADMSTEVDCSRGSGRGKTKGGCIPRRLKSQQARFVEQVKRDTPISLEAQRNEGFDPIAEYNSSLAIARFMSLLPTFSDVQKRLIYEQLLKSGFVP